MRSSPRSKTSFILRRGAVPRSSATQYGLDPFDQQALRKRLTDELVGAHFQAEQFVDLLVLRGEKDHRQVRFLAQPAQRLYSVHAGHLDIEDHKVGQGSLETVERRDAISVGGNAVAFSLQGD
jgi:hypothetical protein